MPTVKLGLLAGLLALGCSEPEPPPFQVRVETRTANNQPLADVNVWLDGRPLGASGARGLVDGQVRGAVGASVELTVACPAGYRSPPPRRVGLRRVHDADGKATPLALRAQCEAMQTFAAIVVRTEGNDDAAFPVLIDGEVVGGTDGEVGHVLVDAAPNATVRVALDTSSRPRLEPHDPVQTFRVGEHDTVLLFQQSFTKPRPPRRHEIQRPDPEPKAPTVSKPYRIR